MKKTILLSAAAALLFGCVNNPEQKRTPKVNLDAIETLADYDVPVQTGKTTVVKLNDDTLAVTRSAMTARVPRYAVNENLLSVTYTDQQIYENFASLSYWQYLSFEDSKNADYDYNDIVLHIMLRSDKTYGKDVWKNSVWIQPVALGSSKKISVGILYQETKDGPLKDKILVQDARQELFFGNPAFPINTDPAKGIKQVTRKLTKFFELNTDFAFKVVWFIEAGGERFYAATANAKDKSLAMISKDGFPYGISLTAKWNYPIEKTSITKAYPGFTEWLKTGDESKLLAGRVMNYCVNTTVKVDGFDLWDYEF